jgi:cytochrome P450
MKNGQAEMYAYCYQKLSERREQFTGQEHDVFDHLLNARVDGEPLAFEKIVANAFLLVIAGLETTSNALTNAFVWMAEHPDQRERLRADPTMIPKAVEEFVRHTGSVHGLPRIATEDMEVGGCPIKKGDGVQLNWAAANRDPKEFENPDELIIDRDPNRHLAFGAGYHRCVGSNLARMEMRVGIEQVLARMGDYRIAEGQKAVYRHGVIPGHASIPVEFSPGKRRFEAPAADGAR